MPADKITLKQCGCWVLHFVKGDVGAPWMNQDQGHCLDQRMLWIQGQALTVHPHFPSLHLVAPSQKQSFQTQNLLMNHPPEDAHL
jgi:hypothetical protein